MQDFICRLNLHLILSGSFSIMCLLQQWTFESNNFQVLKQTQADTAMVNKKKNFSDKKRVKTGLD